LKSDKYIEKAFIYLLVASVLLHVGVFALVYYLPKEKQPPKEPVFIDLQQVPQPQPQAQRPRQQETKRYSEQRIRVPKEMAPRGEAPRDFLGRMPRQPATRPQPQPRPQANRQEAAQSAQREASLPKPSLPLPTRPQQEAPGSSSSGLLKPRSQGGQQLSRSQFFPSAQRLAKLEEGYRRKFENDVAEGDTRFLNSDDILFGSFLRRFENSVYGVWRYPQEAALKGIEGITPVRITFNRRGEITNVQLLETSGAKILDDEVMRTLRAIGPVGSLPKGYDKDEFHLIAFFQYGGSRRSLR
jgi:protein TonB